MRAVVFAFAACCGCGRIGFAALSDASGGDTISADAPRDGAAVTTYYMISAGSGPASATDLLAVDLATAHLEHVGYLDASLGVLGGLAYWDANTLYASGSGVVVEITLSPFSASSVASGLTNNISALESDAGVLIGLDETANQLIRFTPPFNVSTSVAFGTTISGGDIVKRSDGTWLYYANQTQQLVSFDPMTGAILTVGVPDGAPYVAGMLRADSGQFYITSSSNNTLTPIDSTTGALGTSVPLCLTCPTPYPLGAGDATRTP